MLIIWSRNYTYEENSLPVKFKSKLIVPDVKMLQGIIENTQLWTHNQKINTQPIEIVKLKRNANNYYKIYMPVRSILGLLSCLGFNTLDVSRSVSIMLIKYHSHID